MTLIRLGCQVSSRDSTALERGTFSEADYFIRIMRYVSVQAIPETSNRSLITKTDFNSFVRCRCCIFKNASWIVIRAANSGRKWQWHIRKKSLISAIIVPQAQNDAVFQKSGIQTNIK